MKRKFIVFQKKAFQMLIAGLLCFCVSCSGDSNQVDLKLIPVKSGGKWGYINRKGEYVINPQFQEADFFREGLARVRSSDGKIGFINSDGKYEIPAQYKSTTYFSNGLAFVVSECSYPVCIDKSGEIKFSLKQVQSVFSFHEGLALIYTTERKYGAVNKAGETVINPQFDLVCHFSEGLARIRQESKDGFIDRSGKIIINPQFDDVRDFHNGRAVFSNGNQKGYIDTKGNYVINPQFDDAEDFSEGMAGIKSGREYGYINEDGKIEINPQFDYAWPFKSGLARIWQSNKWGYINKKGKIAINPQFDQVSSFFDDIAFVKNDDKWGIIDKKGKYLVNPQFDDIKTWVENFYATSEYYDATAFVNKFFERAGNDNSFDSFTATSTLQNVIDNANYGNYASCPGDGKISNYESGEDVYNYVANSEVICENKQKITDDISIDEVIFHFDNRICSVGSGYLNTTKQYKFDENILVISYMFNLKDKATGKEEAIAKEMKTYIETKFDVKFSPAENTWGVGYDYASNEKMSFAIMTTKHIRYYNHNIYTNYLEFFVAFDKDAIGSRLESYYSMD
jgi:hypothetical protein